MLLLEPFCLCNSSRQTAVQTPVPLCAIHACCLHCTHSTSHPAVDVLRALGPVAVLGPKQQGTHGSAQAGGCQPTHLIVLAQAVQQAQQVLKNLCRQDTGYCVRAVGRRQGTGCCVSPDGRRQDTAYFVSVDGGRQRTGCPVSAGRAQDAVGVQAKDKVRRLWQSCSMLALLSES